MLIIIYTEYVVGKLKVKVLAVSTKKRKKYHFRQLFLANNQIMQDMLIIIHLVELENTDRLTFAKKKKNTQNIV